MANQITVYLDPTQMPIRTDDQTTFDNLWAAVLQLLPTFGAQFNAGIANFNAAAAGSAYAIPYTIDLSGTSDIDPGAGKLRFDNATQNLATTLRLDLLGTGGTVDYSGMIDTFDASTSAVKGSIRIVKLADISKQLLFDVTARTAPTGYRDISVTPRWSTSANPFMNGDAVLLFFQRNGDKGDQGPAYIPQAAKFSDRRASGVGTTAGVSNDPTQERVLNTTDYNTIGAGISLSGNRITISVAGTYDIWGRAPGFGTGAHKASLYNVTDAQTTIIGSSACTESGQVTNATAQTDSFISGRIPLSAAKTFALRHYTTSGGVAALGYFNSGSGMTETYAEVIVTKVA